MNKTSFIKSVILIFLIILPFLSYAEQYKTEENEYFAVNYLNQYTFDETNHIVKDVLFKTISKEKKHLPFLQIKIEINENILSRSYTKHENEQCIINIKYRDKNPILLSNFENDLRFILWHEIGHCLLGRKVLKETPFNWIIQVDNKDELNRKIEYLTDLSVNTIKNKKFRIAPPKAAYHEIFADIYAIMWLVVFENNLQEILILSEKRIEELMGNPIGNPYASGFAIPLFLEYSTKRDSNYSLDDLKAIAQKGFIKYLIFLENIYGKNLKNNFKKPNKM